MAVDSAGFGGGEISLFINNFPPFLRNFVYIKRITHMCQHYRCGVGNPAFNPLVSGRTYVSLCLSPLVNSSITL